MSEPTILFEQNFAVPYSYQQRSYQLIKLSNGIHGLIITDPTEDLASCCLSVAVGHHSNPDDIPGLAHLCEHMISLNSKDFPEIDSYKKLIHLTGGSRNALTTSESTSFFFSIPVTSSQKSSKSDLENILDIFTSNFKNPIFESAYSNREIYAIDNEHTINKTKNNRLIFQGYKLLANNQHQFSRFSTGNFDSLTKSLKKYDIKSQLLNFFKSEYKPDKMTFVLRSPQSLNYLQKLAISKFGKIGLNNKIDYNNLKLTYSNQQLSTKILENNWVHKYHTKVFTPENMKRAILINKDLNPLIRIAFPVSFTDIEDSSNKKFQFFIDFWCEIFGSESDDTLASILLSKELVISISTKTNVITYNTSLLEFELSLTELGTNNISLIMDLIYNYISLFLSNDKKFLKHLAKSMSQFNGIKIYNFINKESESNSFWEAKTLSNLLLEDVQSFGQFLLTGFHIYDYSTYGYSGAYSENDIAKVWWFEQAKGFQSFVKKFISFDNSIVSFVGNLDEVNLDWVIDLPHNYENEKNFDFEFKIVKLNSSVINLEKLSSYNMKISPPNIFAEDIIYNQTLLLSMVSKTIDTSLNAALGYSVKNISLLDFPKLIHHDKGCQLWLKSEVDKLFKDKILLTIELINTKIGSNPLFVVALEILLQLIRYRINSYLYPATSVNYCYDLYPSFKGDTGILIHVSGPKQKFSKVLTVIIYEIKLVIDTFKTSISGKEFEKARNAIFLRYKNGENISSFESAAFGLMAVLEENTWLLDQRILNCENITFENMISILPRIFSSCYLTSFIQGDVNNETLTISFLPIITKLVKTFEGDDYNFPSTIFLPIGSNYYVHSYTKDSTNAVEYFIQTCKSDEIDKKSMTKFVAFLMRSNLENKIRTEYQLGYITIVGPKSLRKTEGIHISVVSGSHCATVLDSKLDDILMEWFDRYIKKIKPLQLQELITKFITLEKASNKSLYATNGSSSMFFGLLGGSGGDKRIVKQHNSYWKHIENKSYSFSNNIYGEDHIDLKYIEKLTIEKIINFIVNYILPTSKNRSKISIQIDSRCSKQEIQNNFKTIQLYTYLSSMGLPIKKKNLEDIINKSGNSQLTLNKNLYKYYKREDKPITHIASVLAKLSTLTLFSSDVKTKEIEEAIPKSKIEENRIKEWQNGMQYVRDSVAMEKKLQEF